MEQSSADQATPPGGVGARGAAATAAGLGMAAVPLLPLGAAPRIPKHMHHVYISSTWSLPKGTKLTSPAQLEEHKFPGRTEDMQTWHDVNTPYSYTWRFWDKPALEVVIKKEYPQYWEAWQALPKDVERADFARYIVLDHEGGTYADSDVSCLRPIADVYHPSDTLVASWEGGFQTQQAAIEERFGRQAQMVNWFLAAAPGHPALRYVMDAINENAGKRFFADVTRDTVDRTGPGIWTQAVLDAAFKHPPSQGQWNVRVVPKLMAGWDKPQIWMAPAIFLLHNFGGSWQMDPDESEQKPLHPADYMEAMRHPLLPTTVPMQPPFTVLHHVPGRGDEYEGVDVSYSLLEFGQWQAGSVVSYPVRDVERLLGGLAAAAARQLPPALGSGTASPQPPALLDIGAGYGMLSLAAASRGHPVLAFELANKSAAALGGSFAYNGFAPRAVLVQAALGVAAGSVCLDESGAHSLPPAMVEAHQHGYGIDSSHEVAAAGCKRQVERQVAADAVLAALPEGARIGVVRVAAYGWTARVVRGLERVLTQHQPFMIALEWRGGALDASMEGDALLPPVLHWLAQRGWGRVVHTGPVCRALWPTGAESMQYRWLEGKQLRVVPAEAAECLLPPQKYDVFHTLQEGETELFYITRPEFE